MLETELKFKVKDLAAIEKKVKKAGGKYVRTANETNYFYVVKKNLMRLRTDPPTLTFKGPVKHGKVRTGFEMNVNLTKYTMQFVKPFFKGGDSFKKKRKTYKMHGVLIELDKIKELGEFVEIEGPVKGIKKVQKILGLKKPHKKTYSQMIRKK